MFERVKLSSSRMTTKRFLDLICFHFFREFTQSCSTSFGVTPRLCSWLRQRCFAFGAPTFSTIVRYPILLFRLMKLSTTTGSRADTVAKMAECLVRKLSKLCFSNSLLKTKVSFQVVMSWILCNNINIKLKDYLLNF